MVKHRPNKSALVPSTQTQTFGSYTDQDAFRAVKLISANDYSVLCVLAFYIQKFFCGTCPQTHSLKLPVNFKRSVFGLYSYNTTQLYVPCIWPVYICHYGTFDQ